MKKQLLALCALLVITNGINAMGQIERLRQAYKELNPYLSEGELSQLLLKEVVQSGKAGLVEYLLKQGITDETGQALESAISENNYQLAELLLQYGSPITTTVKSAAQSRGNRYKLLLQKYLITEKG